MNSLMSVLQDPWGIRGVVFNPGLFQAAKANGKQNQRLVYNVKDNARSPITVLPGVGWGVLVLTKGLFSFSLCLHVSVFTYQWYDIDMYGR